MGKKIDFPGRIHSTEFGNVLTGANEIYDDAKGKKQNVINSETDVELVRLKNAKQDKLTFDATPTKNSTNPVTSGGVYAADQVLEQAIEAILVLIPSAASALNKLADKSFVNSSIATASATFRGTYNLVSDLHLSVTASHQDIADALASAVSTADNNDYCFVQVPTSDTSSDIRVTERYKFNGSTWSYEYDLNNSGFTDQQWNAINSGITALLVTKLGALPTAAELAMQMLGKQNVLTFDNVPVSGSDNPVKSGGLYALFAAIDAMTPTGAGANNKLVAEDRLTSYVTGIINALDATFNLTSADGHVTFRMTQADGLITSVQILTSDIASASQVSTNTADIAALQAAYAGLTQSDIVIVSGALPSSGQQQNVIYRQPDPDHTPPQFYSDYMWNGSTWVLMATYNNAIDPRPKKGSQNLVTSGGVFDNMGALDVSELNATENPHALATYADLSSAIAAIPSDYQKGGMSIKFVLTSDNKYVQYRLTATSFSADEVDWVEIDVEELITKLLAAYRNPIAMSNGFIRCGGNIGDTVDLTINAHDSYRCAIIDCIQGDAFYVSGTGGYSNRLYAFVDSENKLASTPAAASYSTDTLIKIVAPENAVKLILNDFSTDNNFKNSYAYDFSTDPALNLYSKGLLSNKIITAAIYDIIGFDYSLYIDTAFTYYALPFTIKNGTKVKNTGTGLFYLRNSGGTEVFVNIDQEVTLTFDATILRSSSQIDRNYSLHIYGSLENKQDKLTFDDVPVENSNNPVKSRGIYDSIQDLSNNIGLVKIDVPLESNYTGYYISSGGGKYESSLYTISKPFPVKAGDIISIIAKVSESVSVLSYYKTSDDSYEVIKLGEDAESIKEYKQKISKDGLVVVCMTTAYFEQGICSIYRMSDKVLKDSEIINLYNPDTAIDNYRPSFYDGGDIADANFLCSDYIYIKGVSKVTIPYEAHMSAEPYMPYYDSKRTYINKITGTQHGELAEFTIPSEAFYIRVPNCKYNNLKETIINNPCTFMCINGTYSDYPSSYIAYGEIYDLQKGVLQSNIAENPLYGKKVVFAGDSICNGDSDEAHMDAPIFSTIGHGWPVRIGIKNNMLWVNKGISGGTITDKNVSGGSFTISETDFGDNPDYIIMEGGTNDADRIGSILNGNVPANFGSYNIRDYNVEFDNDTFCGAVEYLFKRVLTDYPHAKKGFIIAHKMGISSHGYSADVNNRRAYFETIIALCKKWGIPYIDLWETAPMCPMLPAHYTNAVDKLYCGGTVERPDAQHPTADGFDILSPMIEAWMKTL